MKTIKYFFTIVLLLNFLACDNVDFGDLNENKNGASEPYTAGLLSNAIMAYATTTGRDGLMKPTLYVQYQAQVTYVDEMLYAETPSSWFTYYISSLQNLQAVIDFISVPENQTPATLASGSVNNQVGVATIMKAIILKRVTDTYGDVPYSEALLGAGNIAPAYDLQENIYKGLITELKTARDMLNATETGPIGDIIYYGDVNSWKKLANSVIMQMSLQLSNRYPTFGEYAATEFAAALNDPNGVISTLADEAWFKFQNAPGFRNPWNANRTPDYFMTREFSDALKGNATALNPTSNTTFDERINVFADDPTRDGVPYGKADGSGAGAASVSNTYYWNNTTPLPLMTASYVFLNRADAAEMGWTGENVTNMLTSGITMSYRTLEALTENTGSPLTLDETAYLAARLNDAANIGNAQVIAEEKWVSLFGQAFEAWAEWRRTDIPNLVPATDYFNNGQIPRRYLYPIEENTLNGSKYDEGVSRLTPAEDKGTSRVWWDN
jgi:hypothetical protein